MVSKVSQNDLPYPDYSMQLDLRPHLVSSAVTVVNLQRRTVKGRPHLEHQCIAVEKNNNPDVPTMTTRNFLP